MLTLEIFKVRFDKVLENKMQEPPEYGGRAMA